MRNFKNWTKEDHQEELELWILNDEGLYNELRRVTRVRDFFGHLTKGVMEDTLETMIMPGTDLRVSWDYLLDHGIDWASIWECLWDENPYAEEEEEEEEEEE